MPPDLGWAMKNAKCVFWSNNPMGDMLHKMLEDLVEQKVLEKNDEEQYRFNRQFIPPWPLE